MGLMESAAKRQHEGHLAAGRNPAELRARLKPFGGILGDASEEVSAPAQVERRVNPQAAGAAAEMARRKAARGGA